MNSFLFPDVNVWLALSYPPHESHEIAFDWLESQRGAKAFFCRFTQIAFLRLLTTRAVMGTEVMSQKGAWAAYNRWFEDDRIDYSQEPDPNELERVFRRLSSGPHPSPKLWADAYLAAFASVAGLTLVTFDRTLGAMAPGRAVILS